MPAADYGAFYRECRARIINVDPTAKVYFGELAAGAGGCDYLAAAVNSPHTTITDGLAFHPYQWQQPPTQHVSRCSGIGSLVDWDAVVAAQRSRLQTPAGEKVPLMVTEFGYCIAGGGCPTGPHTLTESERAAWIASAYAAARDSGLVSLFSYYHLMDFHTAESLAGNWHTGIFNFQTGATESARALRAVTGTRDPSVVLTATSDVQRDRVTLNGTVNPNGIRTTYRFEYGRTTAYGQSIPVPAANAGSGASAMAVSHTVSGLDPATAYHYRLVATSRVARTRRPTLCSRRHRMTARRL